MHYSPDFKNSLRMSDVIHEVDNPFEGMKSTELCASKKKEKKVGRKGTCDNLDLEKPQP